MCEQETHMLLASVCLLAQLTEIRVHGITRLRFRFRYIQLYSDSAYVYLYTDSCGSLLRSTLRCPFFLAMQLQYMISISSSPERFISSLCLQVPPVPESFLTRGNDTQLPATLGLSIPKQHAMQPVRRGAL